MKAVVAAFNQEKALVGAFSVIVQPVGEPMDRFTALVASVLHYRRYCREFPLVLPPPSAAWPGLFLVTASHPSLGYSEASLVIETLRQYLSPVLTVCGPGRPRHQARSSPPPPVQWAGRQDDVHHRGAVPPHPGGADRGPAIAGGANDFNAHKYILI